MYSNSITLSQIIVLLLFFDVKKAMDEMDGTEIMGKRVQVSKSTNVSNNKFYTW